MKRKLLFSFLIGMILPAIGQDQLSNFGFNSWSTKVLASTPSQWVNTYSEGIPATISPSPVQKSTDASHLSSSVKLTTSLFDNDTIFGYVLLGSIGEGMPTGGIPFTLAADSLVFDAKFDIQENDTAVILVMFKNNGFTFAMHQFGLDGTQNNWTRYSFPINPMGGTPDSLIIGFTSSNINDHSAIPGSWIQYDNIRFVEGNTTSSPLPNGSFETWEDITSVDPDDWFTFNDFYAGFDFATALKSNDVNEGTFALNLVSDSVELKWEKQFVPGMAVYGNFNIETEEPSGKPFAAKPTTFTGYYKYTPVNLDSAAIQIIFKKDGMVVGDDSLRLGAAGSYTAFNLPLDLSTDPDTVIVMLYSGDEEGSSLFIDNLQFSGGTVGVQKIALSEATIGVYPNPTSADANLKIALPKSATVSYEVINSLGQSMETADLGTMKEGTHSLKLASSTYSTGVYFVKVKIGTSFMTQKVIVK